jgi:hypothetical protein
MRAALTFAFCVVTGSACARSDTKPAPSPAPSGDSIVLPILDAPLPEGPGRDQFAIACLTCHSQRYVTTQPRLSRKTWTSEVDKMQKAYGAPISPEQATQIVDYLVAINGSP